MTLDEQTKKQYEAIQKRIFQQMYENSVLYNVWAVDEDLSKELQELKKCQQQQIERNSL